MASTRDDRVGGYLASALAFAGITGLWAWIVRDDPYYAMTQLLGLTMPVATVFYLTLMPALGFVMGRWRFQADGATGAGGLVAKWTARTLNFLYSHILIVLFTVAMAVDYFFGWNIDNAVQDIDDGLFDIASRFAPWLSAYLAGYNIGRVWAANAPTKGAGETAAPAVRFGVAPDPGYAFDERLRAGEPPVVAEAFRGEAEPVFEEETRIADRGFAREVITMEREPAPVDDDPRDHMRIEAGAPFPMPLTDLDPNTNKPRFSRLR